jgi:hypothetical protein
MVIDSAFCIMRCASLIVLYFRAKYYIPFKVVKK